MILNDEFVRQYRDLRFQETNNVDRLLRVRAGPRRQEPARAGGSLRDYNVEQQGDQLRRADQAYRRPFARLLNCVTRRSCSTSRAPRKLRKSIGRAAPKAAIFLNNNNAQFIEKPIRSVNSYSRLSVAEAFQSTPTESGETPERPSIAASRRSNTGDPRRKSAEETRKPQEITTNIASQQYTKEATNSI